MPFKKNFDRENTLLTLWQKDFTVIEASLESSIPKGSIGIYYKRFNNDSEKYREKLIENNIEENFEKQMYSYTKRSYETDQDWLYIIKILEKLIGEGNYSKANEFLKFVKLFDEVHTKYIQKKKNLNLEHSILIKKERINKFRKHDQKKYGTKKISKSKGKNRAFDIHPLPENNIPEEINQIFLKLISNKKLSDLQK